MSNTFIQIHTLTSYAASLLNRDDQGFAKRITFGGTVRTRVSSQCLKRHWREFEGENNIQLASKTVRSRHHFEVILEELSNAGNNKNEIEQTLLTIKDIIFGKSKDKVDKKSAEEGSDVALNTEQIVVLGEQELDYIKELVITIQEETKAGVDDTLKDLSKKTSPLHKNLQGLGAGLGAAMFGRMTTSDVLARVDAAIHVAHSMTTHSEQTEEDYFSALDDLNIANQELGAGHIGTTELNCGVFYNYVTVDYNQLVNNLGGDKALASQLVANLIQVIATVSPGAKKGSTAPFAHSEFVMVEVGSEQPRSLANAFINPVQPTTSDSVSAVNSYVGSMDEMYNNSSSKRFVASNHDVKSLNACQMSLPDVTSKVQELIV